MREKKKYRDVPERPDDVRHYACDDSLSLEAKGLFTMMINLPFEQFWPLTNDPYFDPALHELQDHGYVGEFGFSGWQICPTISINGNGNPVGGGHRVV